MAVEPTIALHRRARFEQKELECSAKDGESPVCQESQPFIFVWFVRSTNKLKVLKF